MICCCILAVLSLLLFVSFLTMGKEPAHLLFYNDRRMEMILLHLHYIIRCYYKGVLTKILGLVEPSPFLICSASATAADVSSQNRKWCQNGIQENSKELSLYWEYWEIISSSS